jgi:hypothetical protein
MAITINPLAAGPDPWLDMLRQREVQRELEMFVRMTNRAPRAVNWVEDEKPRPKTKLPVSTQFGEIVAHRFWRLHKGYLKAASNEFLWMPGKVATLKEGQKIEDHGSHGVHAFKELERMLLNSYSGEIVFGTVKLWGDVIEYEHGYHAEFASIVSLDSVDLPSMKAHEHTILDELRQRYGVGPTDEERAGAGGMK